MRHVVHTYPVHLVSFTAFMRREVLANREGGSVAFASGDLIQEFSEPTANPKDPELTNTWDSYFKNSDLRDTQRDTGSSQHHLFLRYSGSGGCGQELTMETVLPGIKFWFSLLLAWSEHIPLTLNELGQDEQHPLAPFLSLKTGIFIVSVSLDQRQQWLTQCKSIARHRESTPQITNHC